MESRVGSKDVLTLGRVLREGGGPPLPLPLTLCQPKILTDSDMCPFHSSLLGKRRESLRLGMPSLGLERM